MSEAAASAPQLPQNRTPGRRSAPHRVQKRLPPAEGGGAGPSGEPHRPQKRSAAAAVAPQRPQEVTLARIPGAGAPFSPSTSCKASLLQGIAETWFTTAMDGSGVDAGGLGFGLLISGFWFGFRHGIDWDHIAAIADITSTQDERRRSIVLGSIYAVGHAAVVLVLGVIAILAGDLLPRGIDEVMGRVVGVTLIVLAVYVVVSLIRHGRDFRLRSRWMLVFAGARRAARWVRRRGSEAHDQPDDMADPTSWHHGHHGRPGHHHHREPERDEPMTYGVGSALAVGTIHGIGAETPTQVLIFLAAAGAGGPAIGMAVLVAFVVGLLVSNSLITVGSAFGFLSAARNFAVYATVAVIVATFSLVLGTLFVLGRESVLPAFFSG